MYVYESVYVCVCVCVCVYTMLVVVRMWALLIIPGIYGMSTGSLCSCKNRKNGAVDQLKRKILFCYCCNNEFISVPLLDHISEDSGLRDMTPLRHVSVSRHFIFKDWVGLVFLLNLTLKWRSIMWEGKEKYQSLFCFDYSTNWMAQGLDPGRGKRYLSSPKRAYRLLGTPSLLLNWYRFLSRG
jgi:hypothetical protein